MSQLISNPKGVVLFPHHTPLGALTSDALTVVRPELASYSGEKNSGIYHE